jgi:hypothetical protein
MTESTLAKAARAVTWPKALIMFKPRRNRTTVKRNAAEVIFMFLLTAELSEGLLRFIGAP